MSRIDPFRASRAVLSRDSERSSLSPLEEQVLAQLGPDESNSYYANGILGEDAAIHVQAFAALERTAHSPCRTPFEVRVPRGWLAKVAATHNRPLSDLYASTARTERADIAAWFGDLPAPCDHGPACHLYQQRVAVVRREGYTVRVVRGLVDAAASALDFRDEDLLLRYARSIAVGAGRTRDKASASAAERLAAQWSMGSTVDASPARRIDHANLLRSLAFAQLVSRGPRSALSTVRAAAKEMRAIESEAHPRDAMLSFRIHEAFFPTLETLALCEELWGDTSTSTQTARELVERFPSDSRAWIRLAKSLLATGESRGAITALLRAADSEHPKWLFSVTTARMIAEHAEDSTALVDDYEARRGIALNGGGTR